MATQSLKCDGRKKNGTVDSVRRTYKLCCYSNMLNCDHAVFACYESTLAVHSENPFMVSNLTTGNSGQLKMLPKFRPSQKRRFWIWPMATWLTQLRLSVYKLVKNQYLETRQCSIPCFKYFVLHV